MKHKLKGLLAVALSMACFLSTTPIAGFAAEKMTVSISEGKLTAVDADGNQLNSPAVSAGDKIINADEKGMFYVTVNGEKATENYGENSFEGYVTDSADSEKSGNTYHNSYTVPEPPKGYKEGALVTADQSSDYYVFEDTFYSGNIVNLAYTPVDYKVIFDVNGGEGTIETVNAKYDSEFTLPDSNLISKEGFVLEGWNTAADGSGTSYTAAQTVKNLTETDGGEVTLFAQWKSTSEEAKEFTVTYYLSENEQYGLQQKYTAGSKIAPPASPEKEGFEFAGWILGEENGKTIPLPEAMPEKDIKAYASWELKEYTIKYTVDGAEHSVKTATYGSDIALTTPEDPAKDGYVFAGWYDSEGNNLYTYTTVPASDVVFSAKWLKNGNVVYMVDGKTYEAYEVTEGDKIPVPEDPEKFAHKFNGWDPEIPSAMPESDLTFTAQFVLDKDFITLVVGGTVVAGGIVALIASAGAAAITGISIIGGIITLLGVSSGIKKTYTVTYKVDGKIYKTYKHEAGEKISVPSAPTKSGYKFAGWSPEIPDKMPKKNLTFEAKWTEIKDDSDKNTSIPSTGSAGAGIAAFAALAISAAAAIIFKKKKNR